MIYFSEMSLGVINYWLKILSMDPDSLPKLCFEEQLHNKELHAWATQLFNVIFQYGYSIQFQV
ncbi:hypothetical protein E2320_016091 [Naja naja]|nr:hypothetical protein E2320_016091 [Naja naja]